MKKHLSVLALFVRSTLYKFLLLALVMAAVQTVLFAFAIRSAEGLFGLNTIILGTYPGIVFAACFLLLCALLCLTGCDFSSKSGYTLSRLRISRQMVFLWQSVSNASFMFLLWAAQVGITLAFCGIYVIHHPQQQAAMLVFYSNDFLHSLLPLAESDILVRNIALLFALAVTTACFPVRIRRGERPVAAIIVALVCVAYFVREKGSFMNSVILSMVTIAIAAYAAYAVCKKEAGDE